MNLLINTSYVINYFNNCFISFNICSTPKIISESEMIKMYEPWRRPTARHLNPIIVFVTLLFTRKKCTYDEVDWILEQLKHWIKHPREQNEYATCKDYVAKNKTDCMDNVVITPMGFVDENLNPILRDDLTLISPLECEFLEYFLLQFLIHSN